MCQNIKSQIIEGSTLQSIWTYMSSLYQCSNGIHIECVNVLPLNLIEIDSSIMRKLNYIFEMLLFKIKLWIYLPFHYIFSLTQWSVLGFSSWHKGFVSQIFTEDELDFSFTLLIYVYNTVTTSLCITLFSFMTQTFLFVSSVKLLSNYSFLPFPLIHTKSLSVVLLTCLSYPLLILIMYLSLSLKKCSLLLLINSL